MMKTEPINHTQEILSQISEVVFASERGLVRGVSTRPDKTQLLIVL